MLLASQLTEISGRFPAHVQDLRAFLRKEKLPVPSPDALPQLSSRLESDASFRADVGSLLRVALYQEREQVGYEDLLGILVAAAAGTEHDLKSESQEADIRELLRFVLQSRRSAFRPEAEEESVAIAPEPRETVPVVDLEPVLRARGSEAAPSMKLELKPEEPAVAVAEPESREPDDVVLSPFRTGTLFAAHMEPPDSGRKVQPVWIVGVVCLLAGVGLGLTFHRVVSAAESHLAVRAASFSSKPKPAVAIAPKQSVPGNRNALVSRPSSPAPETDDTASVRDNQPTAQPAGLLQGRSTPPPAAAEKTSGVPMTVVKQVVTALPSAAADSADAIQAAPLAATTRSIVPQNLAGITPANVIFSPAPQYPAAAAAARVHGQVTVHAVVDPDGNVIYARAVSGPPLLRDAAQQAVQRWRYRPLLDNGKPIAVTTTAIVDFKFAR